VPTFNKLWQNAPETKGIRDGAGWREGQVCCRVEDRLPLVVAEAETCIDQQPAAAAERNAGATAVRDALRSVPAPQRGRKYSPSRPEMRTGRASEVTEVT
jgi:hypothetical protein